MGRQVKTRRGEPSETASSSAFAPRPFAPARTRRPAESPAARDNAAGMTVLGKGTAGGDVPAHAVRRSATRQVEPSRPVPSSFASAAPRETVQRVVSVSGFLLGDQSSAPPYQDLTPEQQARLRQMVDDPTQIFDFPSYPALYQYLRGDVSVVPTVTPIAPDTVKRAERRRRRSRYNRKTEPEPTLSQHEAFDKIPREQLYRLEGERSWTTNPHTKKYERRRAKGEAPLQGEDLLEYLDPQDPSKENYGYFLGKRVITTRTDPSSSAGYSRSGASGKSHYKDKRGGLISKRKFPGKNNGAAIQPFKREKDKVTFTIGHSQAVKNMSKALDKEGLTSDEQPRIMVPENRTVGEQMKNPALEPEDRAYVWNNFYAPTPDETFSGHPIPQETQATIFTKGGTAVDFSVRLTNDGSVDYRAEREKARGTRKEYSYREYMLENTRDTYEPPAHYDSDEEPDFPPTPGSPTMAPYMSPYREEDTYTDPVERLPGSSVQHGGKSDWEVGWSLGKDKQGHHSYKVSRTRRFEPSSKDLEEASAPDPRKKRKLATVDDTPSGGTTSLGPSPLATTTTTPPPKTTPEQENLKKTAVRMQESFDETAGQILAAVPIGLRNHPWIVERTNRIVFDRVLAGIDPALPDAIDFLRDLSNNLYQIFRELEPYVRRRLTPAGGDAFSDVGQRLPALEQFFAECGQMAVHNLAALEDPRNLQSYQRLQAALSDETALRQLGHFENQINEDRIRQLLAGARRDGTPVVGNIAQVQGFVNLLNAGRLTALRQVWRVPEAEIQELRNLNSFISGQTNEINVVVNTQGHIFGGGYHWITVRLERRREGIALFYVDSLQAPTDYTALFQSLKQFLANAQNP